VVIIMGWVDDIQAIEDKRFLNELEKVTNPLPCPECHQHKSGWPDTWRNKPGYSGTQYICHDCYVCYIKLGGK